MTWILFILGAYLIGSIPFGVLIARAKGVDIREHGSGNIGATNVGRVLGRRLGIACFLLDAGKGAAPVLIAGNMHGLLGEEAMSIVPRESWGWIAVAMAALVGHMASIFLRFKGGKGVATAFGALLAIWPMLGLPALLALAAWILTMAFVRIVSVASMIAAIALPVVTIWMLWSPSVPLELTPSEAFSRQLPALTISILIAALVLWRHRSNFKRIIEGTEERVGRQSTDST